MQGELLLKTSAIAPSFSSVLPPLLSFSYTRWSVRNALFFPSSRRGRDNFVPAFRDTPRSSLDPSLRDPDTPTAAGPESRSGNDRWRLLSSRERTMSYGIRKRSRAARESGVSHMGEEIHPPLNASIHLYERLETATCVNREIRCRQCLCFFHHSWASWGNVGETNHAQLCITGLPPAEEL